MIKCDPRAKAKCPFKNPCCGDDIAYFVEGSECDNFNQKVLAPPQTNADRIRAMSDEELCKLLMDIPSVPCDQNVYQGKCNDKCKECITDWLQQPAEEDDRT